MSIVYEWRTGWQCQLSGGQKEKEKEKKGKSLLETEKYGNGNGMAMRYGDE
jgi:hypothetical protein